MKEQTTGDGPGVKQPLTDKPTRLLGPLEQKILDTLWSNHNMSGKEVYAKIQAKRPIALTTVLTVLERLKRKGMVTKRKGESVYLYTPAYSREEFARKASCDLFRDLIRISASGATASFVDILATFDPDGLDTLAALVEVKKRELDRTGQ